MTTTDWPRRHAPPTVPASLLFGSALDLRRDQLGVYERAMLTYGSIARFRIGPPGVGFAFDAVFHPDGAREVLATSAADYVKEAPAFTELRRMIGEGLVTSDGQRWRRDRRILQPLFTPQRVRSSYVDAVTAAAHSLVVRWHDEVADQAPVDLHAGAMRYALDVLDRTVLGVDVDGSHEVIRATAPLVSEYAARRGLSAVRSPAWLPTPANRSAAAARRALHALIAARVDRTDTSGTDLMSQLLSAVDPETGTKFDAPEIRDHAMTFLLAGHDTTGSALAFALDLLARRDDVQERVRTEAIDVLGNRPATAADIPALRYTLQTVDEALRLYPPVHTIIRRTRTDTELLGYRRPAGTFVAVSIWAIHRNPEVWPEPSGFHPQRFADREQGRDHYAHLPFGGGPRTCIGVHFALTELVVALATVVRAFELEAVLPEPLLEAGVTLHPRGGFPCRLRPIEGGYPRRRPAPGQTQA